MGGLVNIPHETQLVSGTINPQRSAAGNQLTGPGPGVRCALALAVSDRIREATEQQAEGLARSGPAALVSLAHYSGQPVGVLGQTLGLTHSGAVRLSDRLEAAGLVRRTSAGPGRALALARSDGPLRPAPGSGRSSELNP